MSRSKILSTIFFSTVTWPIVILLLAGDWRWIEGWIFGLWFSVMVVSSIIYMVKNDPALLAERSKAPGADNQKGWDKYLLSGIYLVGIFWIIIMPLDAKRFSWSPDFPLWLKVTGGIFLVPALYLIYQSTAQNTFMSTRVRIQSERKQTVISTGVYAFVRHPLYLGCAFLMLGAPLLLGSIIGLVISFFAVITLVVRIIGEEKMLVDELDGYRDYQEKVRYRLVPLVW
jgi:protein-S-isoprenylcysteine O-methyltransferase Ste14